MDLPHIIDILIISLLVGYLAFRYFIKTKHRQQKKHHKLISALKDIGTDPRQEFSSATTTLQIDRRPSAKTAIPNRNTKPDTD